MRHTPDVAPDSEPVPTVRSIYAHFEVESTTTLNRLRKIAPELGRIVLPNRTVSGVLHATVLPGIDVTRASAFSRLAQDPNELGRLRRTVEASLANRAAIVVPVHPEQPLAWFGRGSKLALRLDHIQLTQERRRLHEIISIEGEIGQIAVDHRPYRPHVTLFEVDPTQLTEEQIRHPESLVPKDLELPESVILRAPRVYLSDVPCPEDHK